MKISILIFGEAKNIIGKPSVKLEVEKNMSIADVKRQLKKSYPKLGSFMLAQNQSYADENAKIKSGDELALIPPTNGG